jgi:predicted dinucleotide-binding enzyme
MPKKFEKELKKRARKMFASSDSERANAYVYGTLRKSGWKPKREK